MCFFLLIMGHGFWLLKSFFLEDKLWFVYYWYVVIWKWKKWFFLVTGIFQSSQLKIFLLTQSNLNDSWGVWVWDGIGCRTRCEKGRGGYEHDLSSTDILNYVALRPTEGVLGKNLLEIEVDSMKPHVKPKVPSKDYSLISLLGRDFPTGETHRWCGDALPSNRNFGCRPPRNLY